MHVHDTAKNFPNILTTITRRQIKMENKKRENEIKVYLTDREFQLAEDRRQDWEDEYGEQISRSQFIRKVLLAWDKLADEWIDKNALTTRR